MALGLVERLQPARVGDAGKHLGGQRKEQHLRWDDRGSHIVFSVQTSVLAGIWLL